MNYLEGIADTELPTPDIKLIYFDVDGTLLNQHGEYPDQLHRAIKAVQQLGIKTAVASGRPLFAAQWIIDDLGLTAPGVFCTGAHLYAPENCLTLEQHPLRVPILGKLLAAIREADFYYELYTAERFYIERDNAAYIRATHAQHLRCAPSVKNFDDIIACEPVVKMLIGANGQEEIAALQALEREFSAECVFAYAKLPAHPDWVFASIVDRNADKKVAFDFLLGHHQISAEQVMSFGDAQSDKLFLQLAGFGIAMGNAAQDVQAVARYTTKAVWNNGIAYALDRLILTQVSEFKSACIARNSPPQMRAQNPN